MVVPKRPGPTGYSPFIGTRGVYADTGDAAADADADANAEANADAGDAAAADAATGFASGAADPADCAWAYVDL